VRRSAAVFARHAKASAAVAARAQQTFQPAAGGVFSVKARWASVGPAASAKKVSDEMLKKLGSLSTQVSSAPKASRRRLCTQRVRACRAAQAMCTPAKVWRWALRVLDFALRQPGARRRAVGHGLASCHDRGRQVDTPSPVTVYAGQTPTAQKAEELCGWCASPELRRSNSLRVRGRSLAKGQKMSGRAVTVRMVPARPDIASDKPAGMDSPEYDAFEQVMVILF